MIHNNLIPITPFPTLLLKDRSKQILLVTDLHLGWENHLKDKGFYLPSQVDKTLDSLIYLLKKHNPDRLIFLGDVKHTIQKLSSKERKMISEFFETIQKEVDEISIIIGNHDVNLTILTSETVSFFSSSGIILGKTPRIGLFHGHAWPSPRVLASDLLIMGHIHPVIRFYDRAGLWTTFQIWIKTECDGSELARDYLRSKKIKSRDAPRKTFKDHFGQEIKDPQRIIMPAFNELIGGLSINNKKRRIRGPLLKSQEINMKNSDIYLLDGTQIGSIQREASQFYTEE